MVAGPPGVCKSTLCTQALSAMQEAGVHFAPPPLTPDDRPVGAYGSVEEDDAAVFETADRVALANFKAVLSPSIHALVRGLDETGAAVWVVDSLMAVVDDRIDGRPGSPSQVNACSSAIYQRCHATGPYEGMGKRSVLLVAHGTKDGDLAGPLQALHNVDGAIIMEWVLGPGGDQSRKPPLPAWHPAPDQTRPTGYVGARVRKMRKAGNQPVSYFAVQPQFLADGSVNPVGGRLDRVEVDR
jgi:hypothetical protein